MGVFRATLVNETEKILKRKKVIAAAILSIIVIIFGQLGVFAARLGLGLRTATGTGFPILILSFMLNTILPLFATLAIIDAFTGEFAHNTIKLTVTRPVTRFKIYLSKICAASIYISAILLFIMALSLVTGLIFNPETSYITGIIKVFAAFVSSILPLVVWILLVALLSNIMKSGTAVFFLSVIIFIALKVIPVILPAMSGILPTSSLEWYKLWMSNPLPFLKIISRGTLMGAFILIFYTSGYYLFLKRDL